MANLLVACILSPTGPIMRQTHIFRMRSLRTDYWEAEIHELFGNKRLFFPSIEQLNDATDCRVKVRHNSRYEINSFLKKHRSKINKKRRLAGKGNLSESLMSQVYQANKRICDQGMSANRVLCLTSEVNSNALWSYYGDSNQGIAFGFERKATSLQKIAPRAVDYVKKLKSPSYLDWCNIVLFAKEVNDEELRKLITAATERVLAGGDVMKEGNEFFLSGPARFAKVINELGQEAWKFFDLLYFQKLLGYSHEREYRQVATATEGYCRYVGMDLVSITFGLNTGGDKVEKIVKVANGRYKLFRMELRRDGTMIRTRID